MRKRLNNDQEKTKKKAKKKKTNSIMLRNDVVTAVSACEKLTIIMK